MFLKGLLVLLLFSSFVVHDGMCEISARNIIEGFERQDKVVVASKVHGPSDLGDLLQMLCLFTQAYNKYVLYDIVIFSTLRWDKEEDVKRLQEVVHPANLKVVADQYTLQHQIASLSKSEMAYLLRRCKAKSPESLHWDNKCCEDGYRNCAPLSYAWQAEFRAYHIWKNSNLEKYKYMLWIDSDALCTKPWDHDPVKYMVENDLVLFLDNDCGGRSINKTLQVKMQMAYNRSICFVGLTKDGSLDPKKPKEDGTCSLFVIRQVHGFFHITNLDFYRNEINHNFLKILVSSHRFSREWDDQIAVTVPAAMEAPDRAVKMKSRGFNLSVWHNGFFDGVGKDQRLPYHIWFKRVGAQQWPEAQDTCGHLIKYGGR